MQEPVKVLDYIMLGELFQKLRRPDGTSASAYGDCVEEVVKLLHICDFKNALNAAYQFDQFSLRHRRDIIETAEAKQIAAVANTIGTVLCKDADGRNTVALESEEVSARLRKFQTLLPADMTLTDAQEELLGEAIRCIECGAYRAAAVMGWNLAYDCIRQWAFDNRLADLNKGLGKVCPDKTRIAKYEDFFGKDAPSERQVIDAMGHKDSGPIIGGKIHNHLVQHLDHRNKYAHASEKAASAHKTNAFIENMIDIITAAPFA